MKSYFAIAALAILLLLAVIIARPVIEQSFGSATAPRPVEPGGSLADYENTTMEIFDRVSPSVVLVVGVRGASGSLVSQQGEAVVQSGTGFVWDAAGHIVTNNHVSAWTNP